jgi:hypothetical protein
MLRLLKDRWNPNSFLKRLPRKTKFIELTGNLSNGEDIRYNACRILYKAGVPCLIWGEDALTGYGIPTIVFDLFLLVHDPEEAAAWLAESGFYRTKPNPRFRDIPQMSDRVPRLTQLPAANREKSFGEITELPEADDINAPGVILLPAKQWRYNLPHTVAGIEDFIPPLATFLDRLLELWMDIPESDSKLRMHIATHIGYFYLYTKEVRNPGFEKQLRIENCQVHFDLLVNDNSVDVELMARRCQQYHRAIRDKIQRREYEPRMASQQMGELETGQENASTAEEILGNRGRVESGTVHRGEPKGEKERIEQWEGGKRRKEARGS